MRQAMVMDWLLFGVCAWIGLGTASAAVAPAMVPMASRRVRGMEEGYRIGWLRSARVWGPLEENRQMQMQQQVPPLRCGMTNKGTGNHNCKSGLSSGWLWLRL